MDDRSYGKRQTVSKIVLICVIAWSIFLQKLDIGSINFYLHQAIVIIFAGVSYGVSINVIYLFINKCKFVQKIYWGHTYIDGVWHYEYFNNNKINVGVWEFTQSIDGTSIVGTGLDDTYKVRTVVRSVSPMIEENGAYYFILRRNEIQKCNIQIYSRTTLLLDRNPFYKQMMTMRAFTDVFGGPSDKELHQDAKFIKHPECESSSELVKILKEQNIIEQLNATSSTSSSPLSVSDRGLSKEPVA
ncbi:MAG: hypothetical protein F8N37_02595 [Telmatospirillum sp.]|nr:hypothetical protein [Telmatospirillum sp.]